MAIDLAINLIAALIAFTVGYFTRRWIYIYKYSRPAGKVWRIDNTIPVSIVTADGPVSESEFASTVYPAEFQTAVEINNFLRRVLKCDVQRICASSHFGLNLSDGHARGNLVILGGPRHNRLFVHFTQSLQIPYEFDGHELCSGVTNTSYSAKVADGAIVSDVGLVVLSANPINPRARVVILAGCRIFGPSVAARLVTESHILQTSRKIRGCHAVCIVVEASIIGEEVGDLDIREIVPLRLR
jgi:hypothetical protein